VTGQWEALEAELDDEADHAATARIRARAESSDMVVVEGHAGDATAEERGLGGTAELAALDSGTAEIAALNTGLDDDDYDSGTAQVEALLDPDDDFLGGTGSFPAPTAPDTNRAAKSGAAASSGLSDQTLSSQTVINLDQADPIAEADFHMAYGLYDQAADLVRIAIQREPHRRDLKLKLLEVFFVWGNKEEFLRLTRELNDSRNEGEPGEWDKIVIMGRQIAPEDPMFSEGQGGGKCVRGRVERWRSYWQAPPHSSARTRIRP
jgi:hypothetical protein